MEAPSTLLKRLVLFHVQHEVTSGAQEVGNVFLFRVGLFGFWPLTQGGVSPRASGRNDRTRTSGAKALKRCPFTARLKPCPSFRASFPLYFPDGVSERRCSRGSLERKGGGRGLKPSSGPACAARLKSCPDTKRLMDLARNKVTAPCLSYKAFFRGKRRLQAGRANGGARDAHWNGQRAAGAKERV